MVVKFAALGCCNRRRNAISANVIAELITYNDGIICQTFNFCQVGRPDCVVSGGLNISLNTAVIYKFPHWIYIHLLFKCERNCYTLRLFEIVYWHSRGNFEKQFWLLQNNLCLRCLIKGSMKYETYIYTVKWSSDCEVPYSDVALSSLHLLWISVIELLSQASTTWQHAAPLTITLKMEATRFSEILVPILRNYTVSHPGRNFNFFIITIRIRRTW